MVLRVLCCLFIAVMLNGQRSSAQRYEVLNYHINSTPVHGVKIKTNLPFTNYGHMVNLRIEGYSYGAQATLGVNLVWYILNGDFVHTNISSWGNDTPTISLAVESGKVVVFIHDKMYFQRFAVTAFGKGLSETGSWFDGWTVADQALTGTNVVTPTYGNKFGHVQVSGNLGIGIATPTEKLAVNGNIRAKEIKVEAANWPDYVFADDYQLPALDETEAYIKANRRLPGMPSAEEVESDGISLGEMNRKLLEKVEELTLHLIKKNQELAEIRQQIVKWNTENMRIREEIAGLKNK